MYNKIILDFHFNILIKICCSKNISKQEINITFIGNLTSMIINPTNLPPR